VEGIARQRILPLETLSRLPVYRQKLRQLREDGVDTVSSLELAKQLGVGDAQLRRDLSYLRLLGRPGRGYGVRHLEEGITRALGLDRRWPLAIVGCGSLGTALARYEGYARDNLVVTAIFDIDPAKVGKKVRSVTVSHIDEAPRVIAETGVELAVIAVPSSAAQHVADAMVRAGVTALLNFAPVALAVPAGVIVRQMDISAELQILAHLKIVENG